MFARINSNSWGEELKLVSCCPICESKINNLEIRILGEDGETRLLHLRCRKCSNQLLALILISNGAVSSIGLITDLSYNDVLRFRKFSQVSIDDVIDIHETVTESGFLRKLS